MWPPAPWAQTKSAPVGGARAGSKTAEVSSPTSTSTRHAAPALPGRIALLEGNRKCNGASVCVGAMVRRNARSPDETAAELVYTDSREVVMSNSAGAAAVERKSVVSPLLLSHGTLMSKNLAASRRFYEEFLGLEVVRHARPAMMLRLRSGMYVVCVCIGEKIPNQHVLTHWALNVASREQVDRAHADAHCLKEAYGIQKIQNVRERHGAYGVYLQDRDKHRGEIQCEP